MSWQEQVTDVAEEMLKHTDESSEHPAYHFVLLMRGYARELKAIVKAHTFANAGISIPSMDGSIPRNPVIEQAKKRAKDDADFAAAELRRQELGGEAMTQLQGGPDDGTFVASPPGDVPVGAKTNFDSHVYQVTEQRGLVYVGEME